MNFKRNISMIRILYVFTIIALFASCKSNNCIKNEIDIIPFPNSITVGNGSLDLSKGIKLVGSTKYTSYFSSQLQNKEINTNGSVKIILRNAEDTNLLGEEGYHLQSNENEIVISAINETGLFYGFQTLLQLITDKCIPEVDITDKPAFQWRAYMLDEARYFHGKNTVKKLLDEMAYLKMNVFHWHLTDDAGWRIEIKKYPLLTEIGS